jgi:hypothetical protein
MLGCSVMTLEVGEAYGWFNLVEGQGHTILIT